MPELFMEQAHSIFPEMMSHPVLFAHHHPKKVAIVGDEDHRILQEVLKHNHINEIHHASKHPSENNTRIITHTDSDFSWTKQLEPNLDVIIHAAESSSPLLQIYFHLLNKDGILIQQSESPFQYDKLKSSMKLLQNTGFSDLQILSFPQPHFSSGWRSAIMAIKQGIFKRIREKMIFNKPFKTHYYNFDIHKAATVLPEFMRDDTLF